MLYFILDNKQTGGNMAKAEVSKSEECKWWQKHVWTKWEKHSVETMHDQHREYVKHTLQRTCKRCGSFEFKHINQYYGETK